jgi:osmotically-inducible protein OsmY
MNISSKKRDLIICAYVVSLACGLGGIAARADAQNAVEAPNRRLVSIAASENQVANQQADEAITNRVKTALHTDPYFYDQHVTVSVEKGSVVLSGFVFSGTDLIDALRIARKAAGNTPVIDNLSIMPERPRR